MRRGFSILLIAIFGFGPLSVLVDSEEANLPPCCRRHGAHHCAMYMRMVAMQRDAASGKMPLLSTPMTCPEYPGVQALFAAPVPALTAARAEAPVLREQARMALAEHAAPETTRTRAHAGRGPPPSNLG